MFLEIALIYYITVIIITVIRCIVYINIGYPQDILFLVKTTINNTPVSNMSILNVSVTQPTPGHISLMRLLEPVRCLG